jgi:ABC-type bacteriocin/lantibiotic exporter with double-glycine peptidase domain
MPRQHAFASFGWLIAQLSPRWRSVALLAACFLALYAVSVLVPMGFQRAIDHVLASPDDLNFLALAVMAIGALHLAGSVAGYAAGRTEAELQIYLENRINRRLMHMVLAGSGQSDNDSGETLTIFDKSASLSSFVLTLFPSYVLDLGTAAICLLALAYYDLSVAMAAGLIALGASILLAGLLARFEKLNVELIDAEMAKQRDLSETLTGLAAVRAQSLHAMRFGSYAAALSKFFAARRRLNFLNCRFGFGMSLTSGVIETVFLAFGGYRLMTGTITVGELLAMQMLVSSIVTPIIASGDIIAKFSEIRATMSAIRQFAEARKPSGIRGRERTPDTSRIAFRDMAIAYEPGKPVLSNVTLALPPRGVVAIVGRNGSGKTTLVRALAGLIDPSEGTITYRGIPSHAFRPRRIAAAMAIVEQDSFLFSGTVAENIARRHARVDHDRLHRVADAAGIAHLLERDGGRVETGGFNFSGGQRQRIAYARALYAGSSCLVLDEPTAFLDAEAARTMEAEILGLGRDRLVLLVTHNMALAARANRIIVVESGRIVGDGPHPELISTCDTYHRLHENDGSA